MLPILRLNGVYQNIKPLFKVTRCDCINRKIHNVGFSDIPKITPVEIRKLLRQKGYSVQEGFTSLITKCFICISEQKPLESKVYINKTTGYFLCSKCNVHGDWVIMERLVKKAKVDVSIKDIIDKCHQAAKKFQNEWEVIGNETILLSKLNENELIELFRLFEFSVSSPMKQVKHWQMCECHQIKP